MPVTVVHICVEELRVDKLFVYGSLQPGGPNEHVMADIGGQWEPARIKGRLVKRGWGAALGYPGILIDEEGDDIRGFLFISSHLQDSWESLDAFEGNAYERVLATATRANGERVQAYVYVLRSVET